MTGTLKNKRVLFVLAAAIILLCAAVWLNLKLGKEKGETLTGVDQTPAPTEESQQTMLNIRGDYFNAFREERSDVRAREIDYLRSIINSENSDEDSIVEAQDRLLELVGNMEKEFTVESRIRGKGFLDAAATIRSDSATVVIDGEALSDEEVARILDIVISETGLPAASIKISLGG